MDNTIKKEEEKLYGLFYCEEVTSGLNPFVYKELQAISRDKSTLEEHYKVLQPTPDKYGRYTLLPGDTLDKKYIKGEVCHYLIKEVEII